MCTWSLRGRLFDQDLGLLAAELLQFSHWDVEKTCSDHAKAAPSEPLKALVLQEKGLLQMGQSCVWCRLICPWMDEGPSPSQHLTSSLPSCPCG